MDTGFNPATFQPVVRLVLAMATVTLDGMRKSLRGARGRARRQLCHRRRLNWWSWSGRRAAASRPCCARSPARRGQQAGAVAIDGRIVNGVEPKSRHRELVFRPTRSIRICGTVDPVHRRLYRLADDDPVSRSNWRRATSLLRDPTLPLNPDLPSPAQRLTVGSAAGHIHLSTSRRRPAPIVPAFTHEPLERPGSIPIRSAALKMGSGLRRYLQKSRNPVHWPARSIR